MQSRVRRAELRVGRMRRQLLNAQMELNDIEFQMLGNEAKKADKKVTEGRKVAEDAYQAVHDQLGSDAPTLPDCLADDASSDACEESEDEEDEDEDEPSDIDTFTDTDYDDFMDLDGVIPPIAVDSD